MKEEGREGKRREERGAGRRGRGARGEGRKREERGKRGEGEREGEVSLSVISVSTCILKKRPTYMYEKVGGDKTNRI